MEEEVVYRQIGQKVRQARMRALPRMSQQHLAVRLGISRASVVNIEAGRQRPPLHVLCQIAATLSVEPASLIPELNELTEPTLREPLDRKTVREIQRASGGDQDVQTIVTTFLQSLKRRSDADDASADS
jgi:transcriptional regulator with XRE-family HTH domain